MTPGREVEGGPLNPILTDQNQRTTTVSCKKKTKLTVHFHLLKTINNISGSSQTEW